MIIQEKAGQALGLLKEFAIDCWITFVRETSLNGDPTLPLLVDGSLTWHSALIFSATGKTIAIVGRYDKKGVEDLGVYDEVIGYVEGIKQHLQDALKTLNPKSIAVNYSTGSEICDGLTHGMYLTLREYLAEIGLQDRLVSAEPIISALRQRKTDTELTFMREAVRKTEEIYAAVGAFLRPGQTEAEIAGFMRERVKESGCTAAWDPASCPSVFTGPDTAEAHYSPTGRRVEEGHVLNMDFGLRYKGYCSDLQRTWYVLRKGETEAPGDVQRGFATILASIEESRKGMKPGATGTMIDAVARGVITGAGYEEFPHALGHQVGRFAHDGTAILGPLWEKYANKPLVPIEERMVFTIEPRLTVPGKGIVTVEEMVVVTKTGAEYLSTLQRELLLVRG
jgi:Xaa-Pro aminopeptidase